MVALALCVVSLLVLIVTHLLYKWWNPKCNETLPPGSMGWPLLGETLQFFAPYKTSDIQPFVKKRMERYGPVFKTNIVGLPIIVSADADFSYFVLQQEGQLFQSWYPNTFTEIFGKDILFSSEGFIHRYLKKTVVNLVGVESLRKMITEIEQVSVTTLKQWSRLPSVEMKDATAQFIFDLSANKLISYDSAAIASENLLENFSDFIKGLFSFPLNIPGTPFHKCLQGRKRAMKMLKSMLLERRENPRKEPIDFLDYVLIELQKEDTLLTETIALNLTFALLFASYETTSLALTVAMKFLVEHESVWTELQEEHEAIIQQRENPDSELTWAEYKSMKFTFQFINETVRLANIVPGIFRKATKDVKYKEYTIPAGWAVVVCPPAVHLNPEKYANPLEFNPQRWEGLDTNRGSRNFMAFGGGVRFCVGAEFSRLQMAVFLHHLVTEYKLKTIKGGETLRSPGLQFPNGYHVGVAQNRLMAECNVATEHNEEVGKLGRVGCEREEAGEIKKTISRLKMKSC